MKKLLHTYIFHLVICEILADIYRACNDDLPSVDLSGHAQGSVISSPNYPEVFPSQAQCKWDITAPQGYRIKIVFLEFFLPTPANGKCENVYLKILDSDTSFTDDMGNLGSIKDRGYKLCGESPSTLITKTNSIVIILHSNANMVTENKKRSFKLVLQKTKEAPSNNLSDGMTIDARPGVTGYQAPGFQAPSPRLNQIGGSRGLMMPPARQSITPVRQPMYPRNMPPQQPIVPGYQNYDYGNMNNGQYNVESFPSNTFNGLPRAIAPGHRPPGLGGAKKPNKNGIPTKKDGRVDTNYRQRMADKMARAKLNPMAHPTPPSIQLKLAITHPSVSMYVIPSTQAQWHHTDRSHEVSKDVKVDDIELSTLALIAIGTGVISVICGITLMLFLYQKRQKPPPPDSYLKYVRDHTPVSRHSTIEQSSKNKNVQRPRDFMDQKDVEMVRTLSRAPVTAPDEYYLKSTESKDSGFCAVSRKASYVTSLKS